MLPLSARAQAASPVVRAAEELYDKALQHLDAKRPPRPPMRRLRLASLLILIVSGLIGIPSLAAAQAPDPQKATAAQALYDQAMDEMEQKRFATACPKLEETTKLIPEALGARMALAECYEGRGKLASAWAQYRIVEGMALKANQPERVEAAGKRAGELKPRLATLAMELASGLEAIQGLKITRDGVDIGAAQAGVAFPADAGSHQILVTAPGYKPWKKSIEILADGTKTTLKIPMLIADPTASTAGAVTTSKPVRPWQKPLGIGAMVVGGAGVGVGALLGGLAIAKKNESNQGGCDTHNKCTDAGLALRDTAVALGNGSTAAIVVGGVLAAGGFVLVLTAPSRAQENGPQKTGDANILSLTATLGGLQLERTW